MKKQFKFLKDINFPSDIKKLNQSELRILADEVREEMIEVVSETGGHLGAGLGVGELTVVLHYIFNTPNEIMWSHATKEIGIQTAQITGAGGIA